MVTYERKEMTYHLATENPTESQKKMNNGMTAEKIRILHYKLDNAEYGRKEGQLSSAQCLELTQIHVGDIQILEGKEKAYLQG